MHFLFAKNFDPALPTVVCLNSDQFNRDVYMLRELSTRYNWVALLDRELVDAQIQWMPQELQIQGLYINFEGPEIDEVWARARALGLQVLAEARAQMPNLVAVLAGNWDYWNEECMRLACRATGLPFLVLMREHFDSPDRTEDSAHYYRVKSIPKVDGVALAGQLTYDMIVDLKLHPAEILRQTGFPRFDIWTLPHEASYDRPVVLFSYMKGYGADDHFVEMLNRFDAIARRHPSIPFLVKAKHKREIGDIERLMPGRSENVKIVDDLVLPKLMKGARAVIGFRSLALYEALLEGAPIFVPYWGQTAKRPRLLGLVPGDERLKGYVEYFNTPEAFEAALEDAIVNDRRATDLTGHYALFGQYFTHSPTETAVKRLERFIDDFAPAT
jgi:hypothetical protein